MLGVSAKAVDTDQLHCGILYKLDDAPVRMAHLAWHFDLRDEAAPSDYFWTEVNLDETNRRVLAAFASVIGSNEGGIPYGLDAAGAAFDRGTGEYIDPPIGKGLTCATFVVAVFGSYGFDLLNEDSWPNRECDTAWQEKIVGNLQANGASAEHIDAIRSDIGAKRFRPEEICRRFAGMADWPVQFADIRPIAEAIREQVRAALQPALAQ